MNIRLIVVRPFDGLSRGDTITDPIRITKVLNCEWARSVVRVLVTPTKED